MVMLFVEGQLVILSFAREYSVVYAALHIVVCRGSGIVASIHEHVVARRSLDHNARVGRNWKSADGNPPADCGLRLLFSTVLRLDSKLPGRLADRR